MTLGRTLNFDETLPVGLPDVLAMQPADRISFHTMVLKAVWTQLWTRIAELDTTLAEGAPDEEGRAAAVNSAQTIHDTVKSMRFDSISALDRARENLGRASTCIPSSCMSKVGLDDQEQFMGHMDFS